MSAVAKILISSSVDSDLVTGIGARIGAAATILTTVSEGRYRQLSAGGWPGKLWLRWLGWVVHPLRLVWRMVIEPRGTVFVVTTNPFFAPVVAVWLGRWRGHRVIHHVFDLYPDALEAAGKIRPYGWRSRAIAAATRSVQRHCTAAVYLGPELRRHAELRHGRATTGKVIDVAADEALFSGPRPTRSFPLVVHYGGQLGAMHDAEALVEAIDRLQPEREAGSVRFDFRVGGGRSGPLLALDGLAGVVAEPVQPPKEWRLKTREMHIGVVTLTPAAACVCFPSKTYALLAAGLAVLAIAPRDSDLARVIEETGAGWVVDNQGIDAAAAGEAVAALIRKLVRDPRDVWRRREAARFAAMTRFSRQSVAKLWQELLVEVTA